VPTGSWTAAVDTGMFNDSYGNIGPMSSIVKTFTVYPTNVTITQLTLGQNTLQRTQTETFSFPANYITGPAVQTGSAKIRLTESDGTTFYFVTATYNSTSGLYQTNSKMPASAETGVWVASIDTGNFNDSYGNGGPTSSVVRGFTVQLASLTMKLSISNQTYGVGQIVPIYATITYPDNSQFTNGTVIVSFALSGRGNQTGSLVSLSYVQGQSRWAGSYQIQSTDLSGLWIASVKATDMYGNTAMQTSSLIVSVPVTIPPSPSPSNNSLNLYWFILAALAIGGGSSGLVLLRKFNMTDQPFDTFFQYTGGAISPSTVLLIEGDAGAGTTTLSLQLIYHQLQSGKPAGLLTYDSFPTQILRNMQSFGWDVTNNTKNGTFKILDCYSALAGIENPTIRDPVDFTEISIRVSQLMENTGPGPYLLVLDSLSPIFNGVNAQTTINFLRVLSAKIKKAGGILVLTGSMGSTPESARPGLENLVDGVIELAILHKGGKHILRTLTVQRLADRKTLLVPGEFEIVSGKGIVFRKPRIPLKILMSKHQTN
jgi:KaiC/GvpD/RAD55 family RecA-like ATPase